MNEPVAAPVSIYLTLPAAPVQTLWRGNQGPLAMSRESGNQRQPRMGLQVSKLTIQYKPLRAGPHPVPALTQPAMVLAPGTGPIGLGSRRRWHRLAVRQRLEYIYGFTG